MHYQIVKKNKYYKIDYNTEEVVATSDTPFAVPYKDEFNSYDYIVNNSIIEIYIDKDFNVRFSYNLEKMMRELPHLMSDCGKAFKPSVLTKMFKALQDKSNEYFESQFDKIPDGDYDVKKAAISMGISKREFKKRFGWEKDSDRTGKN